MGWTTEDDYDDSITVFKTIPDRQTPQEEGDEGDDSIVRIADTMGDPFDSAAALPEDYLPPREPTLRLDIESIEVLRIQAVTHGASNRHVMRMRENESEEFPF